MASLKCPICGGIVYEPADEPGRLKCVHCSRYFKEGKEGLELENGTTKKLNLTSKLRTCATAECGNQFAPRNNRHLYCDDCATDRNRERGRQKVSQFRERKKAEAARGPRLVRADVFTCPECGALLTLEGRPR